MTLLFYAQPYDISAEGFYFRDFEEYTKQAATAKNQYGDKVEEFEIQFIDGGQLDAEFAKALGLNQVNIQHFIPLTDEWQEHEKIRYILAVDQCGYAYDLEHDSIDLLDVEIYEETSIRDLAIRFVEEGLFGDIPERLQFYIDYDAIARDLSVDYSEAIIAGERLIYRCG